MYKIGMIGERDSVLGFMALGFSVHEADNAAEAENLLCRLADSEEYAVIYVVENFASEMPETLERLKSKPLPAVIPIPGRAGATGFGRNSIKSAVERAVGADILKD